MLLVKLNSVRTNLNNCNIDLLNELFVGWLNYPEDKVRSMLSKYIAQGFTAFKIKVGDKLEDDIKRCKMVRDIIGWDRKLVRDLFCVLMANQFC